MMEVVPFAVEMTDSLTPMKPFIHQDKRRVLFTLCTRLALHCLEGMGLVHPCSFFLSTFSIFFFSLFLFLWLSQLSGLWRHRHDAMHP